MKKLAWAVASVLIIAVCSLYLWATRTTEGIWYFQNYISTNRLVSNLSNNDEELAIWSLRILFNRKDPSGIVNAKILLNSSNRRLSYEATSYLAYLGDDTAIPFLIKFLPYAYRGDENPMVAWLQKLTGQKFNYDFRKWYSWYSGQHPNLGNDFWHPSCVKAMLKLDGRGTIFIDSVMDTVHQNLIHAATGFEFWSMARGIPG